MQEIKIIIESPLEENELGQKMEQDIRNIVKDELSKIALKLLRGEEPCEMAEEPCEKTEEDEEDCCKPMSMKDFECDDMCDCIDFMDLHSWSYDNKKQK